MTRQNMRHRAIDIRQRYWYIADRNLVRYGRGLGGMPRPRGRVRCPRADLQPAPGQYWASSLRHYDRNARCVAGLGKAGAGNARSKGCAKRVPAASQEAWLGAASLEMKNY